MKLYFIRLNLLLSFFILFPSTFVSAQASPFNCDSSFLKKGDIFEDVEEKSLEGSYEFTMVPTWDSQAETATGELHLFWEDRYLQLQDSMETPLVNYPLVGYARGDFKSATMGNFNNRMGQEDPFDPGHRYFPEKKILKSPGGSIDTTCADCITLTADISIIKFQIKRNLKGTLVGKWKEDFGILAIENSEGEKINEATGYFCAEPKN